MRSLSVLLSSETQTHAPILKLEAASTAACNLLPTSPTTKRLVLLLLPKLPKCLLRSPASKTRFDVHRTSDSLGCIHLGGHRAGFNLAPCTLWNGLGFAQRVVMSLSSLKCFAPEAEACSDIAEVSSMISDIMMKCMHHPHHSRLLRRSWNGNRGARMEVLYGSQQERSHTSEPASSHSHVSGNVSVSSRCILILIGCLKLLMFVLRKMHP